MFVACCVLFVVWVFCVASCPLCVDCCSWFVVRCLLFVGCCGLRLCGSLVVAPCVLKCVVVLFVV